MKFAITILGVLTSWGCDASCDHGAYCSEDGLSIITCDERGDHEYVTRCRGETAVCIDVPYEAICALSATQEPLCDETELDLICKGDVQVICKYGYRTYKVDCSIDGLVCNPEAGYCVMPASTSM